MSTGAENVSTALMPAPAPNMPAANDGAPSTDVPLVSSSLSNTKLGVLAAVGLAALGGICYAAYRMSRRPSRRPYSQEEEADADSDVDDRERMDQVPDLERSRRAGDAEPDSSKPQGHRRGLRSQMSMIHLFISDLFSRTPSVGASSTAGDAADDLGTRAPNSTSTVDHQPPSINARTDDAGAALPLATPPLKRQLSVNSRQLLQAAFARLDSDGDGLISREDARQYYAKVVKGVSSEENAEMMMAEFNVIGDKISFTAFVDKFKSLQASDEKLEAVLRRLGFQA